MINQIRRLLQGDNRKAAIRESVIHWLSDEWRSEGLVHNFVMSCSDIDPWVSHEEVADILAELESEDIAQSMIGPLVEGYAGTVVYWRKVETSPSVLDF